MFSFKKSSGVAVSRWPLSISGSSSYPAYFSLALAGAMWVYSFLNYFHAYPITTFYQEWGTALLGMGAMILLLGKAYWQKAEIPRIVLLPIGLMLLVVAQFLLGKVAYFGQMMLYVLYLMWAAMLVMLGARLREVLGLPTVATALAVFLLVGAELNAFAGMHQHYHWQFLYQYVTVKVSSAVFGNVAQPNHYADYLTLGLISLGLLYARGALRAWQAVLLALPILFVLPLTGSRETWVYLIWLVGSTFVWQWFQRAQRPLFYFSAFLLVGFGLMHLVVQLPWFESEMGSVNSVQRMMADEVNSGGIRLYLWHEAGLMFLNSPLLGNGFGQYGWLHYQLAPQLHNTGINGLYNNAHNLVMQLAAEGGLAALAVLGGTMLLWVRQAYRAERTIYHWWGYALLSVLAIHSMLEYPLWYAYFLGIAALTLGLLDSSRYHLEFGVVGRALALLTLVLGAISMQQLYSGYRVYEQLMVVRPDPQNPAGYYDFLNGSIDKMHRVALWRPYADMQTSTMIEVSPDNLDDKLRLNDEVVHFVPFGGAGYRQSMLLAQKGDMEGAKVEMGRAIWSFPGDFAMAQNMLGNLILKDPAHFRALLEFAIQKHEEYLSAVRTK